MCGFFDKIFKGRKKGIQEPAEEMPREKAPEEDADPMAPPPWLRVLTGLRTKERDLYFVVKLENHGANVMGESTVTLSAPEKVVRREGLTRKFPHIDPGQGHKEVFLLNPTYRPGGGMVEGRVTYFDFDARDEMTFALPPEKLNFFVPPCEPVKVDNDTWRLRTAALKRYEIETEEVPVNPERLFKVTQEALEPSGFFAVQPIISPGVYRGVGQYLASAGGSLYAFEVQVIGRDDISRMLITALGPDDIAARAAGFRVVDLLSGKLRVREAIIDPSDGAGAAGDGPGAAPVDRKVAGTGAAGGAPATGEGNGEWDGDGEGGLPPELARKASGTSRQGWA